MSIDLPAELIEDLKSIVKEDEEVWNEAITTSVYQAGLLLNDRASEDGLGIAPNRYWQALIEELYILLCTEDAKYTDVRKEINDVGKVTGRYLVPTIATGIAVVIGVETAILFPFVGLALLAIIKLGQNTWCSVREDGFKENINSEE